MWAHQETAGLLTEANGPHPPLLDLLCRACRAARSGDGWADLHDLCDPLTYWCGCPCGLPNLEEPDA